MFAERSARVLYAVGSGLHELQHALDGIADLHQRLDVFVLHAGCGSSEHHGLGTHGASELDADPVFRDGEQDVHRDGIRKEPALFQPDNKYRCIGAGITGIQLKIKVAVLCAFRLYALSFLIMGFNVYASSFFTALGDGVTSALISFLRTLAFQVIAILLLPMLLGIDGIWLAVTAAELAALAVSAAMLLTKDKVFHYRKA